MNTIGITQWRGQDGAYPLPSAALAGLFSDASFVLFDNETPLLVDIQVANSTTFDFMFDGVNVVSFVNNSACVTNGAFQLRNGNRYYGTLVFGENVSLLSNYAGTTMEIGIAFHGDTVRTINSSAGLYSIQGQTGAIDITTDSNIFVTIVSGQAQLNAVSLPNQIQTVTSTANALYVWDSQQQTLTALGDATQQNLINPSTFTESLLNTSYAPAITYMTAGLIGASNVSGSIIVYNCNSYPWNSIQTIIGHQAQAITTYNSATYVLLSTGNIFNLTTSATLTVSGLNLKNIVGVGSSFLLGVAAGPPGMSDLHYQINPDSSYVLLGAFSAGSLTMPGTQILTYGNYNSEPVVFVNSGTIVYAIPAISYNPAINRVVGNLPKTYTQPVSLLTAPWSVAFSPAVPLATINDQTPYFSSTSGGCRPSPSYLNSIQIIGDNIVTLNNTGQNQITVAILIDDALTNINRTANYG